MQNLSVEKRKIMQGEIFFFFKLEFGYFKNEPISSCDEHMLKPKFAQFSQTI